MLFLLGLIGEAEERGIIAWRKEMSSSDDNVISELYSTYNLPFCMPTLRKWSFTKYIPICPTFTGIPGIVFAMQSKK